MATATDQALGTIKGDTRLKGYYFTRAAFSIVWVGAAIGLTDNGTRRCRGASSDLSSLGRDRQSR